MMESNQGEDQKSAEASRWTLFGGIVLTLMGLVVLSNSSGFISGLKTYFWDSTEGRIVSNDLRFHKHSGSGEVVYSVEINGAKFERSSEVFKRWTMNKEEKYQKWVSKYAVGNTAEVFYSKAGATSLGHWPTSYSYGFAIQGISTFVLGLSLIFRGSRQIRANSDPSAR